MRHFSILFLVVAHTLFCNSQTLNKKAIDDDGSEKLLGIINKEGLSNTPYNEWFSTYYDDYLVNEKVVKKLKDSLKQYEITVFLGTWCGDSKREVPRFYNILRTAKFPESKLKVIAVDRTEEAYKQSPTGEEQGLNIHRVPTFIFYKNGNEVNRIVESPLETLENDILKIVTENKYTPNYMAANYLNYLLNTKTIDSLQIEEPLLVPRLAEFVKGSRELNTYGYSLLRSNKIEKALYVFDLNTKIFPYKHNVFDSLGEAYYVTKNYTAALKCYYKVLSLKPDEKNALEMIEKIKQDIK